MAGKFIKKTIVMVGAIVITVIFIIGTFITVTHINKSTIPDGLTEQQIIEIAFEALPNKTPEEIDVIINSTLTEEQQSVAEQAIQDNFTLEAEAEVDLDTLVQEGAITDEEADRISAGMDTESATHTDEESQQSINDMLKQMEEELKRLQEESRKQQEQEEQDEQEQQGDQTPSDQGNTSSDGSNNSDESGSQSSEDQESNTNSDNTGSTGNNDSGDMPPEIPGFTSGDLGGDDSFEDNKGGYSEDTELPDGYGVIG